MDHKVAFVDTVHPLLNERLEAMGYQCLDRTMATREALLQEASAFHGIIIRSRLPLDADFLKHAPHLQFIARAGAGMENIDVAQAEEQGIVCFNAPEGNRTAVGEHTLALLLHLFNKVGMADQSIRQGTWDREDARGVELSGKTVGIIGYGNMGQAFAKVLRGFDVRILAYDKYRTGFGSESVLESALEGLFKEADVVSLHVPYTSETHYMVNKTFLHAFQKPIWLINTARGKVVNTGDLAQALAEKKVLGAGLDVLEYESTAFENALNEKEHAALNTLLASRQTVFTPHVAGWSVESYQKISAVLADKIGRWKDERNF